MLPLILLASTIDFTANLVFTIDIVKGNSQPNLVTWGLWTIVAVVGFAIQVDEGYGIVAIYTLAIGLGPFMTFITGLFKQHKWKLGFFDFACGTTSLIAILLWLIYDASLVSFALVILADFFALLPTLRKAYLAPETETPASYVLAIIASVIALVAGMKDPDLLTVGYPLYITIAVSIGYVILKRKNIEKLFVK